MGKFKAPVILSTFCMSALGGSLNKLMLLVEEQMDAFPSNCPISLSLTDTLFSGPKKYARSSSRVGEGGEEPPRISFPGPYFLTH